MKITLSVIFLLITLIWGAYSFYFGYVMAPDSGTYTKWADILIKHNFNFITYPKDIDIPVSPYIYLGFVSCIALAKVTAGLFWPQLVVLMNAVLGALVGVMIADLVFIFTKSKFSVWAVFILYTFNLEALLWPRYILGDVSFMFVNFMMFYFICKLFLRNNAHKIKYWIVVLFLFFLNCIWPSGIIMAPVVLFAFYLSRRKKEISWKAVFIYSAAFIMFFIFIHAVTIRNILPALPGKSAWGDFMVNTYREGSVIDMRFHTYHGVPHTLLDYIFITIDKIAHFFYFSDSLFSSAHIIVNTLIFVPMYALFILGVIGTAREQDSSIKRSLIALGIGTIVTYALFHAMIQIDYDWRYRLPAYPYLLIVSGVGINFLLKRAKSKISRFKNSGYFSNGKAC